MVKCFSSLVHTCIPSDGAAVMLRPRLMIISEGVTTEKRKPPVLLLMLGLSYFYFSMLNIVHRYNLPCWSAGLKDVTMAKFSNIESGRSRECGVLRSEPARRPNAGNPWSPSAKYTCLGSSNGIDIACSKSISENRNQI